MLGALPTVHVATPWWQDVEPVVEAVRAKFGGEITVLRMLDVGEPNPTGIEITYLAETADRVAVEAWRGDLEEHPLRLAYARPGGPAAALAWAEDVLARCGHVLVGPPIQVRTWNLSSVWRLPVQGQTLWLKAVPPFFAHEGAVLDALSGCPVPALLGYERGRILMSEIPGTDLYHAVTADLLRMIDLLVALQTGCVARIEEFLRLGLADWRAPRLCTAIEAVIERNSAELPPDDRVTLESFVKGVRARFAAIAACGLPDTLVHGDFHPGNFRGNSDGLTLLDWGDCGVGHPLLDQSAFFDRISSDAVETSRHHWHAAWKIARPGCDPARASVLLAPVAAARQATIYQGFLDSIEPSERPYHQHDPLHWLKRTAILARAEGRTPVQV